MDTAPEKTVPDEKYQKYTDQKGYQLQFKAYSINNPNTSGSKVQREKDQNQNYSLRRLDPSKGEFSFVERKYSADHNFNFYGNSHIGSTDDVAFLFRKLQQSAIENVFLLIIKDTRPIIIHLNMGVINNSLVCHNAICDSISRFQGEKCWFVHNHPSGSLKPSSNDILVLSELKQKFPGIIQDGIILDIDSGYYSVFNESSENIRRQVEQTENVQVKFNVYKFDKQIFKRENQLIKENLLQYNPYFNKIENIGQVVSFIAARRLAAHNKLSMLILSTNLKINANVHLINNNLKNTNELLNEIETTTARFAGTKIILYGTGIYNNNDIFIRRLSKKLKGVEILDIVDINHQPEIFIKDHIDEKNYTSLKEIGVLKESDYNFQISNAEYQYQNFVNEEHVQLSLFDIQNFQQQAKKYTKIEDEEKILQEEIIKQQKQIHDRNQNDIKLGFEPSENGRMPVDYQWIASETIEFPAQIKNHVTFNYIHLVQAPNGSWAGGISVHLGLAGFGDTGITSDNKFFQTKEEAIIDTMERYLERLNGLYKGNKNKNDDKFYTKCKQIAQQHIVWNKSKLNLKQFVDSPKANENVQTSNNLPKKPWEMSKEEFEQLNYEGYDVTGWNNSENKKVADQYILQSDQMEKLNTKESKKEANDLQIAAQAIADYYYEDNDHEKIVKRALEEGKNVPPEVLQEYGLTHQPVISSIIASDIDLEKKEKETWMQTFNHYCKMRFSIEHTALQNGETAESMQPRYKDDYSFIVGTAINEGEYVNAIQEGRMSASDAKFIIESASLNINEELLLLYLDEKTFQLSSSDIDLINSLEIERVNSIRIGQDQNPELKNMFDEDILTLRENPAKYWKEFIVRNDFTDFNDQWEAQREQLKNVMQNHYLNVPEKESEINNETHYSPGALLNPHLSATDNPEQIQQYLSIEDYNFIIKETEKPELSFDVDKKPLVFLISAENINQPEQLLYKIISQVKEIQPNTEWTENQLQAEQTFKETVIRLKSEIDRLRTQEKGSSQEVEDIPAEETKPSVEENYYKTNEIGKFELYFNKNKYDSLPEPDRKEIKNHFLWSRNKKAWISKSKGGYHAESIAKKHQLTFVGKDKKLSFQQEMEKKEQHAEYKIERFQEKAYEALQNAEQLQSEFNRLRKDWSWLTQPVIRGHAGSARFERSRNRVIANYEKGFEEQNKALYYKTRQSLAEEVITKPELKNINYLQNRIKESEKSIRKIESWTDAYQKQLNDPTKNFTDAQKDKISTYVKDGLEKLEYYYGKLSYFKLAEDKLLNANQGQEIVVWNKASMIGLSKFLKSHYREKHNLKIGTSTSSNYITVQDHDGIPNEIRKSVASFIYPDNEKLNDPDVWIGNIAPTYISLYPKEWYEYLKTQNIIFSLNPNQEKAEVDNIRIDESISLKIKLDTEYQLGAKWNKNFDYNGMLAAAIKSELSWGYENLIKLYNSFESVNFHEIGNYLWTTLEYLKEEDNIKAEENFKEFKNLINEKIHENEAIIQPSNEIIIKNSVAETALDNYTDLSKNNFSKYQITNTNGHLDIEYEQSLIKKKNELESEWAKALSVNHGANETTEFLHRNLLDFNKTHFAIKINKQQERNYLGIETGTYYGQINYSDISGWTDDTFFQVKNGKRMLNEIGEKIGLQFSRGGGSAFLEFNYSQQNIDIVMEELQNKGYHVIDLNNPKMPETNLEQTYKLTNYGKGFNEKRQPVTVWYSKEEKKYYVEGGDISVVEKYIKNTNNNFTLFGLTEINKEKADLYIGRGKDLFNIPISERAFGEVRSFFEAQEQNFEIDYVHLDINGKIEKGFKQYHLPKPYELKAINEENTEFAVYSVWSLQNKMETIKNSINWSNPEAFITTEFNNGKPIVPEADKKSKIEFLKYSERAHIIVGNTFPLKDILNDNKAIYNKGLTHPITKEKIIGWVIPSKRLEEFKNLLGFNEKNADKPIKANNEPLKGKFDLALNYLKENSKDAFLMVQSFYSKKVLNESQFEKLALEILNIKKEKNSQFANDVIDLIQSYVAKYNKIDEDLNHNHRVFIIHNNNHQPTEFENLSEIKASELYDKYLSDPSSEIVTWDKAIFDRNGALIERPTIKMDIIKPPTLSEKLSDNSLIPHDKFLSIISNSPSPDEEMFLYETINYYGNILEINKPYTPKEFADELKKVYNINDPDEIENKLAYNSLIHSQDHLKPVIIMHTAQKALIIQDLGQAIDKIRKESSLLLLENKILKEVLGELPFEQRHDYLFEFIHQTVLGQYESDLAGKKNELLSRAIAIYGKERLSNDIFAAVTPLLPLGIETKNKTITQELQPSFDIEPVETINTSDIIDENTINDELTDEEQSQAEEVYGSIKDFGEKIGGARKDYAERGYTITKNKDKEKDTRPAWMKKYDILTNDDETFTIVISNPKIKSGPRSAHFFRQKFSSIQEAQDAIPFIEVSTRHRVYSDRKDRTKYSIYRVFSNNHSFVVRGGFNSENEAMGYMALNAISIIEFKPPFPERPHLDKIVRIGENYRTSDITPADFQKTFGFRGGEFGNWLPNDERQSVLNYSYDCLLDLARILNVPPKALSLDGALAVAFGARGHGLSNATAHYEPSRAVFNLTRIKGAGAVAHEWFHAFDHYLARLDGKAGGKNENGLYPNKSDENTFISHSSYNKKLRQELFDAWKKVNSTIIERKAIVEVDITRYQKQLNYAKENLESQINDLKRYLERDDTQYRRTAKPANAEQLEKFESIIEKIWKGETGKEQYISSKKGKFSGHWGFEITEELSKLYKEVKNREETGEHGKINNLTRYIKTYNNSKAELEKFTIDAREEKNIRTNYLNYAKDLDSYRASAYFSLPHEISARAFEAYIADKIESLEHRSDYLVYGADNKYYKGHILSLLGIEVKPYPESNERIEINQAFDNFFKTVKTQITENDNVIMFRKSSNDVREQKIQFVCSYYERENAQKLAHQVKEGDEIAISLMAFHMSFYSPENAILVPIPNKTGKAETTLEIAKQIADYTSSEVFDIIEGKSRESLYNYKKEHNKIPKKDFLGFRLKGELPDDNREIFLIDNVLSTGLTYDAALDLLPNSNLLVHSVDLDTFKTYHPKAEITSNAIIVKRSQIFTHEFQNWFENSKVVDEKGIPIKVYHASNFNIDKFNKSFLGLRSKDILSFMGFHFSPNKEMVELQINNKNVISTYLSIKNPYIAKESEIIIQTLLLADKNGKINHDKINFKKLLSLPYWNSNGQSIANVLQQDAWGSPFEKSSKSIINYKEIAIDFLENLKLKGHDGIKYINELDWPQEERYDYIAFEPYQIKHAELNTGKFSPVEESILFRKEAFPFEEGKQNKAKAHFEYVRSILTQFNSLASNVPSIIIVMDQSELIKQMLKEGSSQEMIYQVQNSMADIIDSFFDPSTNKTYFVASNIDTDKEYIKKIFIHEQLQHNGLRQLIPDDNIRNGLLTKIVTDLGREKILQEIKKEAGSSYDNLPDHLLANEYLAFLAEKKLSGIPLTELQQSFWQKLKNMIWQFLFKIFQEDYSISDEDLTILIRASAASAIGETKGILKNPKNPIEPVILGNIKAISNKNFILDVDTQVLLNEIKIFPSCIRPINGNQTGRTNNLLVSAFISKDKTGKYIISLDQLKNYVPVLNVEFYLDNMVLIANDNAIAELTITLVDKEKYPNSKHDYSIYQKGSEKFTNIPPIPIGFGDISPDYINGIDNKQYRSQTKINETLEINNSKSNDISL